TSRDVLDCPCQGSYPYRRLPSLTDSYRLLERIVIVRSVSSIIVGSLLATGTLAAQFPPGQQGSSNMRVMAHIPLGGNSTTSDIEMEQELSRPYVYVDRRFPAGFDIINV